MSSVSCGGGVAETMEPNRADQDQRAPGRELLGSGLSSALQNALKAINQKSCGKDACTHGEHLRYKAYVQILSLPGEIADNNAEALFYHPGNKLSGANQGGAKTEAVQAYGWKGGRCRAIKEAKCSLSKNGDKDQVSCTFDLKTVAGGGGTKAECDKGALCHT